MLDRTEHGDARSKENAEHNGKSGVILQAACFSNEQNGPHSSHARNRGTDRKPQEGPRRNAECLGQQKGESDARQGGMAESVAKKRALAKKEKSPGESRSRPKKTCPGQHNPGVVILK